MKRFGLWLLATIATTAIAYVAVNAAGSNVTERPITAVIAAPSSPSTTPSTSTTSSKSTTPSTSTTSSKSTTPSTSTTSPTVPTETSATPTTAAWQRTTLNSAGGSIIVSHRVGEVRLESVVPTAGFAFEINDEGPTRVEVEFEADNANYRIRAEWTSSGFVTEIEPDED